MAGMTRDEVSVHEVRLWLALTREPLRWMSNVEMAAACKPIAPRTVRLHTDRWAEKGLLQRAATSPGHRFRWSEAGARKNAEFVKQIARAAEAFGLLAGKETP